RPLLDVAEVALTGGERLVGLLGRDWLPPGEGLLILGCRSVHTFFMRFPIDVVYVSRHNTVAKIVEELQPYRFSWCLRGRSVVEMPAGWAAKMGLRVGHGLRFDSEAGPIPDS
ncbi:MAG: DUF192 domain-containing protein, partial [Planctomycetota bacterium]